MASVISSASFSVLVEEDQLIVNQVVEDKTITLCILSLRDRFSFFVRDGKVVCLCSYGQSFVLETVTHADAHELLGVLTKTPLRTIAGRPQEAAQQHVKPTREGGPLKVKYWHVTIGLTLVFCFILLGVGRVYEDEIHALARTQARTLTHAPAPSEKLTELTPPQPEPNLLPPSVRATDDGWSLPAATRAKIAVNLRKAAERKKFTVDYSGGHDRTLYVFSDPSCPNCQRLEPALNALSDTFNVVVFPVSVIGKEKSVAAITPVLCLPPEQRKVDWDALFDPVPEGVSLAKVKKSEQPASEGVDSKTAQAGECEEAEKVLGINHMAYQAYSIPGTPWAISDDGRHVSQALLRDPLKLQAFLDQQQPALSQGQEVSDASK